jgi:hypothetical protein
MTVRTDPVKFPMAEPTSNSFGAILASVSEAIHPQGISGFMARHVLTLRPEVQMQSTLHIGPRLYDVAHREASNEPLNPGYFATSILATVKGIALRLSSRALSLPELAVSVPIGLGSITVKGVCGPNYSPDLNVNGEYIGRSVVVDGGFAANDFFRKGMMEAGVGCKLGPQRLGVYFSHEFSKETWLLRAVAERSLRKGMMIGGALTFDVNGLTSIVASVQKAVGKTVVAACYEFGPRLFRSRTTVGLKRDFMTSAIAASITGQGMLSSSYTRQLSRMISFGFTVSAVLSQRTYIMGLTVTLQQ